MDDVSGKLSRCDCGFRLRQGWRACKGVRVDEGSWHDCEAAGSPILSKAVSDRPADAWQVCPWKRIHV